MKIDEEYYLLSDEEKAFHPSLDGIEKVQSIVDFAYYNILKKGLPRKKKKKLRNKLLRNN